MNRTVTVKQLITILLERDMNDEVYFRDKDGMRIEGALHCCVPEKKEEETEKTLGALFG